MTTETTQEAPAVTVCKRCRRPIVRCETLPAHFGCSSAHGWIHSEPRTHACEPRSDGPYAVPAGSTP